MNSSINKGILISGLNCEISAHLMNLKNRILSWHEHSSNAENEVRRVIYASKEILELMRVKSQLLESKESFLSFSFESNDAEAPVENTKKTKRKR